MRVIGEQGVFLCRERLLWCHRSPLEESLGKGPFPQLRLYNGSHPLIVRTLARRGRKVEERRLTESLAEHLGRSPQLCGPGSLSLLCDHDCPALQTGAAAALVVHLLEQGQALLVVGICCWEVTLLGHHFPQEIERMRDVLPLLQRSIECQALLEQGLSPGSLALLEVPQSQAIERPGSTLLVVLLLEDRQALLEQRAHPRRLALVGVSEECERKGHERIREADLVADSPVTRHAFFEHGSGFCR